MSKDGKFLVFYKTQGGEKSVLLLHIYKSCRKYKTDWYKHVAETEVSRISSK